MSAVEENRSFLEFVLSSDWKFLQERTVPLDLYHSGYAGLSVAVLAIVSATVFLLAMFHIIPNRKHTILLLLSLGILTLASGFGATYLNFRGLPENVPDVVRATAGNLPSVDSQVAAVYALPLALASAVFTANVLSLSYLAVFWGSSAGDAKNRERGAKRKRRA